MKRYKKPLFVSNESIVRGIVPLAAVASAASAAAVTYGQAALLGAAAGLGMSALKKGGRDYKMIQCIAPQIG